MCMCHYSFNIFEGVHFIFLALYCQFALVFSFLVYKVNFTDDTWLLFTVYSVEKPQPFGGLINWNEKAAMSVKCRIFHCSQWPFQLVHMANQSGKCWVKWPLPHNQMIIVSWSEYNPCTTNISFVGPAMDPLLWKVRRSLSSSVGRKHGCVCEKH